LVDQQWAHRCGISLPVFHSRIPTWPFALNTLALAQGGERSKGATGQQRIQRIEQSVATFTKNAPIYRVTKFDTSANVLLGGDWWCHNPNSAKGRFCSRARQPTILSKLEFKDRDHLSVYLFKMPLQKRSILASQIFADEIGQQLLEFVA
jgi:hypothetical protein